MRKITSKQQENKKRRRNQIIVSVILISVMFFSVLGYSFRGEEDVDSSKKIIYNGFGFEKKNNFWFVIIENTEFGFKYNPKELNESINSGIIKKIEDYRGEPLYINSEDNEAELEIYRNFYYITQRIQKACLTGEECNNEEMPVKTCKDNFIIIKENNESKISQRGNCIFIQGQKENLIELTDKFLFKILGVEN